MAPRTSGPPPTSPSSGVRTTPTNPPAALLASQTPGLTVPGGNGNPFPTVYSGWQRLTSSTTSSPYYATINFCTGQCWYDQNVLHAEEPALPDTVYVIGSFQYGELPCLTKGVGCGNNRSNGRGVLYSDDCRRPRSDATTTARSPTSPTTRRTRLRPGAPCLRSRHACSHPTPIHPDQHQIVVNPSNPNQIFEGSDGGRDPHRRLVPEHVVTVHDYRASRSRPGARSRASGCCRGSRT